MNSDLFAPSQTAPSKPKRGDSLDHEGKLVPESSNVAEPPSLYKYVPIPTLKHLLEHWTIRFTQPSAFNDPFELLPEVVIPNGESERRLNLQFDLTAPRTIRPTDTIETVPEGYTSSDPMSRDIVQQLNQTVGILCLSRARDSLPMWSHYAQQYAGAVVEFDAAHEFFSGHFDVDYRSIRPRWQLERYTTGGPIPLSDLCVKSSGWAYEQEVRIARSLSDCKQVGRDGRDFPICVQSVSPSAIKSIIIGERTTLKNQRAIFLHVQDTNIALSFAAISHSGYEFREELIKFPVPISQMNPMISPRTAHIFKDMKGTFGDMARWLIEKHPLSRVVNSPV